MNEHLRNELLVMRELDITMRKKLVDNGELSHNSYHPEMKKVHEQNNSRIMEIVSNIGWPTENIVGEDGSEAAWLIVQHANLEPEFQKKCLKLLRAAVENGEANSWHLAYLQDRALVQEGKPQLFGTQNTINNPLCQASCRL